MAKLQGRKQTARKKATNAGAGKGQRRTQTAKKKTPAVPQLTFRQREKSDDAFIVDVTMQTLRDVYQESVGAELREEHVLEWTNAGDYTGIIELDGKPVGYYSYLQHMPNRWYIGAMVVTPQAQGQGIGKQIFSHVEQQARQQGIHMIEAHVQVENKDAIEFWSKQGFEVVGQPMRGSHLIRKTL